MIILDLDMDYFMNKVAHNINEKSQNRLDETLYRKYVWEKERVISFLERNLGLSKDKKVKGRIVHGHNEALLFWRELINKKELSVPFDVIHIDSHADLGLGYLSWMYILNELISFPVKERPAHNEYAGNDGTVSAEGIGDYLLFAVAYRWIANLTYCANPCGNKDDYVLYTLKYYEEEYCSNEPVINTIQLVKNDFMDRPDCNEIKKIKQFFDTANIKEPEVPLKIVPKVEQISYNGDFDYAVLAQSPNYTPQSADYIMEIFRDYIEEI